MIIPRVPEQPSPPTTAQEASIDVRARLAVSALDLFEKQGYDSTTVDDISAAVGISRRTFFRYFAAKEDAVFTDQARYLARLRDGLEYGAGEPIAVAGHSLGLLLEDLLQHSELARRRDALILSTPALADREVIWWGEYQHLLGAYLGSKSAGGRNLMFSNIVAAALLAAFRQVVTHWLRSVEHDDPMSLFSELVDDIAESMVHTGPRGSEPGPDHPDRRDVIIISSDLSRDEISELIEKRRT
jgi:AcrR family transcriptional regulator